MRLHALHAITLLLLGSAGLAACESTTAELPGGNQVAASPVRLTQSGKDIANPGTYFIPLNNGTSTVALFSEQREPFSLVNHSGAELTIQAVTVTVGAGVKAEEFSLQSNALKPTALVAAGQKLAADTALDFYVRFYPVRGGDRTATLNIATDKGNFAVALTGKGQTEAAFFSAGQMVWEKVYGAPAGKELLTGMTADANGNLFFSANHVQGTYEDVLIGRINADGSAGWAQSWGGSFRDLSKDPGQNGESGGSADAISMDSEGFVYVVTSSAGDKNNNTYFSVVLKVDPKDGAIVWQKAFGYGATIKFAKQNAEAYAVDASGDHVYVTGTTGANSEGAEALVLFLALSKSDGSVVAKKALDINAGVNDRGYAIRQDGKGGAFIGGNGSKSAILLRVKDIATAEPKLDWARQVDLGTGGNVNSIDVDAEGNAYVALDRRGATSYFSVGKVDATGALKWAKTYSGGNGDKSNIHAVRVVGSELYIAGRIATPNFDSQYGDALAAALATSDGALKWSAFHYSGKGPDEIAEHRIKGIALRGKALYLATQVFTGNFNGVRYSGYWYDGLGKLEDFAPTLTPVTKTKDFALADGAVFDAAPLGKYQGAPAAMLLQDATAKKDGKGPDADVMMTRIDLK